MKDLDYSRVSNLAIIGMLKRSMDYIFVDDKDGEVGITEEQKSEITKVLARAEMRLFELNKTELEDN